MTVFKATKVANALKSKGFIEEPTDHRSFVFYYKGKRTKIRTKTSNNGQDINDHLIDKMKKQTHLSKADFCDLINCPLKEPEYINKLKSQGIIKDIDE